MVERTSQPDAPASPGPVTDVERRGAASGAQLTIDLSAVAANYRHMRSIAGNARTAGVVKADGYGLGAVQIARRLASEGCDLFFVAHLAEALTLRQQVGGPLARADIAVLNGIPPGFEAEAQATRITPVLNSVEAVHHWIDASDDNGAPAYLQIDTGMNRLGLDPDGLNAIRPSLDRLTVAGLMSHFACADAPDDPMNQRQRATFLERVQDLPRAPLSLANSAAVLSRPDCLFDMVRPGIGLYGCNPFADRPNPMTPVVRLEARVLQVRRIDSGEAVGYGASYIAQEPRRVATLSMGYADGFLRAAGGRAVVRIADVRAPVIGRVSMDLTTIDVTDVPEDRIGAGSLVTVLDNDIEADDLGRDAGTLGYEILTSLGARYARVYRDTE